MTYARNRLLWTFFALITIVLGTYVAIRFAQGYRPSSVNLVAGNGLLVANSEPKGARVLVNGRFLAATDETLYLDPGDYEVQIQRDGYFTWSKNLRLEQEVVTQANAQLFPTAPGLTPLTLSGAEKPVPSPDGQKLAYYTASSSAETKNGYYINELVDNQLAFQRGPRQVLAASSLFPIEDSHMVWSPDSTQILLISPQKSVLLDPTKLSQADELTDVTFQLPLIFSQWEEEMYQRDRERLAKFPVEIQQIATASAVNVYFSPDEKRLMYTATEEFTLPENILPAKPGSSTQPQARTTEIGSIYIYDRDEDRQFKLGLDNQFLTWLDTTPEPTESTPLPTPAPNRQVTSPANEEDVSDQSVYNPQKRLLSNDLFRRQPLTLEASPSAFTKLQRDNVEDTVINFLTYHSPLFTHKYQWFPNSWHVISHNGEGITIQEADGTNIFRIYSGPFDSTFTYPWPNGSRLIIRTNFNQGDMVPINLYTINLK